MTDARKPADDLRARLPQTILEGHEGYYPHARIKEVADLLDDAERALCRVTPDGDYTPDDGATYTVTLNGEEMRAYLHLRAKLQGQA